MRRLRLNGLHHVTLVCRDVTRSAAFYRNVLGLRLVKQTTSADDRGARHLFFGDEEGRPGTLITSLEYPNLEPGRVGAGFTHLIPCLEHPNHGPGRVGAGSTHHFALAVESEEELHAWRDSLTSSGIPCSEVLDRTYFKSIYLRDPDGHVIELATSGPGLAVDEEPEEMGRRPVECRTERPGAGCQLARPRCGFGRRSAHAAG